MTAPDAPIDREDLAILGRLAALDRLVDPPPADLDDRVRFAIAVDDLDRELAVEVARPAGEALVGSGARASERTRTITFEADTRTIMITIVDRPDGSVRVDGWLAPAEPLRVELRFPEPAPAQSVDADETGRFVFDRVPHGLAQLLVHPPADGGGPRVVTPSLAL
jgi:hypothetical protein